MSFFRNVQIKKKRTISKKQKNTVRCLTLDYAVRLQSMCNFRKKLQITLKAIKLQNKKSAVFLTRRA